MVERASEMIKHIITHIQFCGFGHTNVCFHPFDIVYNTVISRWLMDEIEKPHD